jgi:putative phage-type endonuclease
MNGIYQRVAKIGKAYLKGQHAAGSTEWLAERANTIGGSDIASIMNISPWTSAFTLWGRKQGLLPEQPVTSKMLIGNIIEPAIVEIYKAHHPNAKVHHPGHTWESNHNPRFHANPDGFVEDESGDISILEIKHTSQYWRTLPDHYTLQVMWYQHVTGLTTDAVVAAVTASGYEEYRVEYMADFMKEVEKEVIQFLFQLDNGEAPEVTGDDSTLDSVRSLSKIKDEEVEVSAEDYEKLLDFTNSLKVYESAVKLQKAKIMQDMNGARWGYVNGKQVVSLRAKGEGNPYLVIEQE